MTSYPAPTGYAPSYSWIGAPTAFNGTNPLSGGDSCEFTFHLQFSLATTNSTRRVAAEQRNLLTIALAVENLNQWYSTGDQAYIIVASAMVLVMIPGLGFLYSGLARRKSALTMLWITSAYRALFVFVDSIANALSR